MKAARPPPRFFRLFDRSEKTVELRFLDLEKNPEADKRPLRFLVDSNRLGELRLAMASRTNNRNVILTGRGPVEAYLAAGYYAILTGANRIFFKAPGAPRPMELPSSSSSGEAEEKKWIALSLAPNGGVRAEILPAPDGSGKWSGADQSLSRPLSIPAGTVSLLARGRGSVAMYAHLGCSAALAGVREVVVEKPQILHAILVRADGTCSAEVRGGEKNGIVVGILGDPNSGKSVFARALDAAVGRVMPSGMEAWVYDCDYASPTPDWSLSGIGKRDRAIRGRIRDAGKAEWSPVAEDRCADALSALRKRLDLTIADMPGGKHPKNPGDAPPQRIPGAPSHRAAMMSQCDAFIVLCRTVDPMTGKPCADGIFEGWRSALAAHGLANRIVARLESENPGAPFSATSFRWDEDGILRGVLAGLLREKTTSSIGETLAEQAGPLLNMILALVRDRGARSAAALSRLPGPPVSPNQPVQ